MNRREMFQRLAAVGVATAIPFAEAPTAMSWGSVELRDHDFEGVVTLWSIYDRPLYVAPIIARFVSEYDDASVMTWSADPVSMVVPRKVFKSTGSFNLVSVSAPPCVGAMYRHIGRPAPRLKVWEGEMIDVTGDVVIHFEPRLITVSV